MNPSKANFEADSITLPGRDKFVRLHPHVFAEQLLFLWRVRYRYYSLARVCPIHPGDRAGGRQ